MSSFRKSSTSVSSPQGVASGRRNGVKPWINGLQLVSSGNNDLDEVLGGGIVLGSMTLLCEDEHSNYAETLMMYSIAESISKGHKVLVLSTDVKLLNEELLNKLPLNINAERAGVDEVSTPTADSQEHLKIAWQYGKYMQAPTSKQSSFCCSYDLNDKLQSLVIAGAPPLFHHIAGSSSSDLQQSLERIREFLLKCQTSNDVPKVYLCRVGETESDNCMSIARMLLAMKYLLRDFCAAATVLLRPALTRHELLHRADSIADTVIAVESFAGRSHCVPVEFRYFCGFLNVLKLHQISSIAPHRSAASRFGLKRNRRKLCIEQLHLPPEESRAVRSDVEKAKSAAPASSVICSAKTAANFDF